MKDKLLNLTESIYEYLPVIKEVFKDFYGEKYASLVEERLDNATYIGYALPKDIENILSKLYQEKTTELIQKFFFENSMEYSKEMVEQYFNWNPNLQNHDFNNIEKALNYLEKQELTSYEKSVLLNTLKKISANKDLEPETEEYKKTIEKIKELKESYEKIKEEFKLFQVSYKKYEDYIEACKKLKEQIHTKYTKDFFEQIWEYLSDKDKRIIESKNHFYTFDLECDKILIESNYERKALIDAFSSESESQLEDENTRNYVKDSIKQDRIKYFKKIGIDLGEDYNNYRTNPLCQEKMPSKELADKIARIRENLFVSEQEEYITSTTMYQEQLSQINKLGLLDKDIPYTFEELINNTICINPNIIRDENTYKMHALLLFSITASENYIDKFLIHECNHLIELSGFEVKDQQYKTLCGFDESKGSFVSVESTQENEKNHRNFELFNEIINELIAGEVTTLMHEKGIYLFDKKETAKNRGGTSYEKTRVLVEDFYQTYKEEIIESRLTGNLEKFFSKVGYENIMNLSNLVTEYGEHFTGFSYYHLLKNLEENKETEDVFYFRSMIAKRNQILVNMQENYKKNASNMKK